MSILQPATNLPATIDSSQYWPLIEIHTLSSSDVPLAAKKAMEHLFRARSAKSSKKLEVSLEEYKKAMVLWFEADTQQPGLWAQALHFTNMEYASLLLGR